MTKKIVERALIGTDASGRLVVLATDGAEIACWCREVDTDAERLGIACPEECPAPGLYLFEGSSRPVCDYETGAFMDVEWDGPVRPVGPEEVAGLYAMRPPKEEA